LSGKEKEQLAKHYTDNASAYQLYLKGRYFEGKASPDGVKKGIEYSQQAIEADPGFALAYAGLADSYFTLMFWAPVPPREVVPQARATARKALEIDDSGMPATSQSWEDRAKL
jgi:hypothetical protein